MIPSYIIHLYPFLLLFTFLLFFYLMQCFMVGKFRSVLFDLLIFEQRSVFREKEHFLKSISRLKSVRWIWDKRFKILVIREMMFNMNLPRIWSNPLCHAWVTQNEFGLIELILIFISIISSDFSLVCKVTEVLAAIFSHFFSQVYKFLKVTYDKFHVIILSFRKAFLIYRSNSTKPVANEECKQFSFFSFESWAEVRCYARLTNISKSWEWKNWAGLTDRIAIGRKIDQNYFNICEAGDKRT